MKYTYSNPEQNVYGLWFIHKYEEGDCLPVESIIFNTKEDAQNYILKHSN